LMGFGASLRRKSADRQSMNRLSLWRSFLFAALLAPTAHAGETSVHRPSAASRVVRVFDFEEQEFNQEPVPRHWIRAQDDSPDEPRPGFPRWNHAAFDFSMSSSGQASVK